MKNIKLIILIMFIGGCVMTQHTNYQKPAPIATEQDLKDIQALVEKIKRKQNPLRWEKEIRSKNWSSRITDAVINNEIILGMTKEQVIASWDHPEDINRSVGSWGVHEQWIYRNDVYLYFEDGILTSFQD